MRHDLRVLVLVMVLAMLLALSDVVVRSHATAAAVGALGFGVQQTEVLADTAKGDDVRRPTFMYRRESRFRRFLVFSGRSDDRTQECPYYAGLCFVDTHRPPGALPNTPIPLMDKAQWPIWSASGHYFAFQASRGGPQYYPMSVYVYRVVVNKGTAKPELWQKIDRNVFDYVWAPSALEPDQLLYAAWEKETSIAQARVPYALVMYTPTMRRERVVDRAPWLKGCPELNVLCAESEQRWTATGFDGFSWSPDAKFIVYPLATKVRVGHDADIIDSDLWIARADGTTKQQLTHTPNVVEEWPKWLRRNRIEVYRARFDKSPVTSEKVQLTLATPRGTLDHSIATLAPTRARVSPLMGEAYRVGWWRDGVECSVSAWPGTPCPRTRHRPGPGRRVPSQPT